MFSSTHGQTTSQVVPIFGPEWTFANDISLNSAISSEAGFEFAVTYNNVLKKFIEFCKTIKGCVAEVPEDNRPVRFTFDNGVELFFTSDPGVIEFKARPFSESKWAEVASGIQSFLFNQMAVYNFFPHEREGAGHINIGLSEFRDNPLLLRNFIVDFYNNPGFGIVMNSLEANKSDAAYLDQLSEENRNKILEGFASTNKNKLTVSEIVQALSFLSDEKYVALGIRDAKDKWVEGKKNEEMKTARLEVRTLRPQKDMEAYLKVIRILKSRIQFLSKYKKPIPVLSVKKIEDGWVALGEWADYIEESGLKIRDFKSLLPEIWRELPEENYTRKTKINKICRKSVKN